MDDVLNLTRRLGREPNLETALHILQWELGDLTKSITYMKWHPDLATAYEKEAMAALGSLLFQARVCTDLLKLDFDGVVQFGIDTVRDRIVDKEKKIGRFGHYVGDKGG